MRGPAGPVDPSPVAAVRRAAALAARGLVATGVAGFLLSGTGCASMQQRCAGHPWLLCGDRVTVRRAHVYLDDPAYLYRNKAVARSEGGIYSFSLSLFFNPHRVRGMRMTAALRFPDAGAAECRVASGERAEARTGDAGDFAALDSAYLPVATARKERISLRFLCRDYLPRWGREDTLELRFAPVSAAAPSDSATALALPFTTGFRGPVYSFVAGSLLLVTLTAAGEILAAE